MTRFLLICSILLLEVLAMAQTKIEILEQPGNGVQLIAYRPGDSEAFDSLIRRLGTTEAQESAFVLLNSTGQPITGLVVQWTTTDKSGKEVTSNFWTDSYTFAKAPVSGAGVKLLIMPSMVIDEETAKGGSFGGSAKRIRQKVRESVKTGIRLDVVILENGDVIGPDRRNTVANIIARKQAADIVRNAVSNALRTGDESVSDALSKLAVPKGDDPLSQWIYRTAKTISMTRDMNVGIESLGRLPNPPQFHKR